MRIGPITFREERVLSDGECRGFDMFAGDAVLDDAAMPYAQHLRSLVARFTGLPELHQEAWTLIRRDERWRRMPPERGRRAHPAARRFGALLWLEAPATGGGLDFLELGAHAHPEPGILLVWNLTDPAGEQLDEARGHFAAIDAGQCSSVGTWACAEPARSLDTSEEITREIPVLPPEG